MIGMTICFYWHRCGSACGMYRKQQFSRFYALFCGCLSIDSSASRCCNFKTKTAFGHRKIFSHSIEWWLQLVIVLLWMDKVCYSLCGSLNSMNWSHWAADINLHNMTPSFFMKLKFLTNVASQIHSLSAHTSSWKSLPPIWKCASSEMFDIYDV